MTPQYRFSSLGSAKGLDNSAICVCDALVLQLILVNPIGLRLGFIIRKTVDFES